MTAREALLEAVIDLDEDKSYELVTQLLKDGVNTNEIIEILREGVEVVGDKFSKKEYFLTMFGASLLKQLAYHCR